METAYESRGLHEHPAKHQAGVFGKVCRSGAGVYFLKMGGSYMSCPQDWAARIEAAETSK